MSGPPPKRARVADEDPVPTSTPTDFARDEQFWFDDGSIVLVAQNIGFRVFRSLLAAQSTVFADMLTSGSPTVGEVYDGCPVVRLSDSPHDLRYLLRVLIPAFRLQ